MKKKMFDVIIIGAGFSGLYQLYLLKKNLNLNCHLFEKAPELGGTWYWNKYPGARCDTESKAYCYFFDKKIYNKWDWSERYPSQPEIQKYLKFVAKEFNLFENISFSSDVSKMRFNNETNTWKISLSNGKIYNSKFVVAATGCLSKPNQPTIKNLNNFKGQVFHTALWPSYKVNFKSQNIVVFGTGSSGIQIIPEIAKECKSLTVLQRTANFSIPAKNFRLDKYQNSKFKNNFDQIKSISFNNRHGHPWEHSKTPIDESNLNVFLRGLERAWEHGGLSFRDTFSNINYNNFANKITSDFIINKIKRIVKDPQKGKILTNFNYPFGAKRPALDTNYFDTFNKENVDLIDLKSNPIEKCYNSGLIINKRNIPADIIIFATGFDAITGSLLDIDIQGKNSKDLSSEWRIQPNNYLGLQIPNFPNLFTITGPGSPSVLTNMPRAIEQHVEWITKCISYLLREKKNRIEACPKYSKNWLKKVHDAAKKTMFLKTENSWYLGSNIEGKPVGFIPYSGGLDKYSKICKEVETNKYEGFLIDN